MRPAKRAMAALRSIIRITGTVQGVGFRPFVYRLALEHGITGDVSNTGRGVVIDACGLPGALDAFARAIADSKPPLAVIRTMERADSPADECPAGFRILQSSLGGELEV